MNSTNSASGSGAAEPPVWEPARAADPAGEVEMAEIEPVPVTRSQVRARPPRRSGSTTALLVVALLVAFGGVGFAVGHATAGQSSATNQNDNFAPGQFPGASGIPGGGFGGGLGGGTVTGTVVSVAADSITVKLSSGSTVTVATGASTTYHNQTSGSSTDLAAGQTVQVQTSGGGGAVPNASASPGTQTSRTATDVTITAN